MNLFKWLRRKPKTVIRVIPSTEITLDQWQSSPELVTQARRIMQTNEFRAMIDCLKTESPANFSLALSGVTQTDRAVHALHIEGYNLCLNTLAALAKPADKKPALNATFENTMAPQIPLEDAPYVIPNPTYQPD